MFVYKIRHKDGTFAMKGKHWAKLGYLMSHLTNAAKYPWKRYNTDEIEIVKFEIVEVSVEEYALEEWKKKRMVKTLTK